PLGQSAICAVACTARPAGGDASINGYDRANQAICAVVALGTLTTHVRSGAVCPAIRRCANARRSESSLLVEVRQRRRLGRSRGLARLLGQLTILRLERLNLGRERLDLRLCGGELRLSLLQFSLEALGVG